MDGTSKDVLARVREVAVANYLIDPAGELVALDSLNILDFVSALEEAFDIAIPSTAMTRENFASVDDVAALVAKSMPPAGGLGER